MKWIWMVAVLAGCYSGGFNGDVQSPPREDRSRGEFKSSDLSGPLKEYEIVEVRKFSKGLGIRFRLDFTQSVSLYGIQMETPEGELAYSFGMCDFDLEVREVAVNCRIPIQTKTRWFPASQIRLQWCGDSGDELCGYTHHGWVRAAPVTPTMERWTGYDIQQWLYNREGGGTLDGPRGLLGAGWSRRR